MKQHSNRSTSSTRSSKVTCVQLRVNTLNIHKHTYSCTCSPNKLPGNSWRSCSHDHNSPIAPIAYISRSTRYLH